MPMGEEFDHSDLEALRKLRPKTNKSYADRIEDERRALDQFDGRRLRAVPAGATPRAHPMNVRVRFEIKAMVLELVHHHRSTITEVVETAIEQLHAATLKP